VSARFPNARELVASLRSRGIDDPRVLAALEGVPREQFVPPALAGHAWDDNALPIDHRQTISQPYMVAWMTQHLKLVGTEEVLEIGTGSGYQTAILSRLARSVTTIERIPELSAVAAERLARLGCDNVTCLVGDGSAPLGTDRNFDAILVTAGAPDVPQALIDQLNIGGRLVIPVGDESLQDLRRIVRTPEGLRTESCGGCRFVKLVGSAGWSEPAADSESE
jgi:protein-L-isoaspartate(D-aspartate) O-methyltransferase